MLLRDLDNVRIIAGGTDLLVDLKEGLVEGLNLVSLQHIQKLKGIAETDTHIRIGALVTPEELRSDKLIKQHFPALAEAAGSMASAQIRSMATIGGNIASAVPSADLPPILMAAEASVMLTCSGSSRELPLADFFVGPRRIVCEADEILVSIMVPFAPPKTGFSYKKMTLREANALAVASVAVRLTLKKQEISQAAVVLGAVAPTPLRALRASEYLLQKDPSEEVFLKTAALAQEESLPISDIRGSAWFRQELVRVLTCRALAEAVERAQAACSMEASKP